MSDECMSDVLKKKKKELLVIGMRRNTYCTLEIHEKTQVEYNGNPLFRICRY